jgi:hypothetical protein
MEHDLSGETFERLLQFLQGQDIDAGLEKEIGWNYKAKS